MSRTIKLIVMLVCMALCALFLRYLEFGPYLSVFASFVIVMVIDCYIGSEDDDWDYDYYDY
ncbi:hypothetical protein RsoM2USA_243 [Ralstonia phage RsoM2USA]|nr:hypothetical protein RsoM2USA_243 [Ralstonia phage RsoM2USA]